MKFVLLYELEVLDELAIIVTEMYDEIDAQQNFEPYRLCDDDEDDEQLVLTHTVCVRFDKTELLEDELEEGIETLVLLCDIHWLEVDTELDHLALALENDEVEDEVLDEMPDLTDILLCETTIAIFIVEHFIDDLERKYAFDEQLFV